MMAFGRAWWLALGALVACGDDEARKFTPIPTTASVGSGGGGGCGGGSGSMRGGGPRWAVSFGDDAGQRATDIDVDESGDVLVAGAVTGTITLAGEHTVRGARGAFVTKLAGADGSASWS